jgi:hypothetical protein
MVNLHLIRLISIGYGQSIEINPNFQGVSIDDEN